MSERSLSNLGAGPRSSSWPVALIGLVVIKAVLSLALAPGSFLNSYSGISYFLLLLLGTSFAIRNGLQNTLGTRRFWMLLAIAYGLWSLDQGIFLYYELGLHIEVPNNSIADPVLFLHVVPLIAALAILPHRSASERKLYRTILESLLLLFFWIFLYGYIVLPYEYSKSNGVGYELRFDILYLLENLSLALIAGILTLRVQAPWKSIYGHLLGASTLYTLSSTVANLAIDSGGYVNGQLYGLGLTASVCWFVWIPLCGRQLTGNDVKATRLEGVQSSKASAWAMIAVAMISIPIVLELFQRSGTTGMRTVRLVVAIAAIVGLASAAYVREYLGKRKLASNAGIANDRLRLAMESGKSVGWDWNVKSGQDTWFGDLKTMFGIQADTHVGHVEDFRRIVHPDDRGEVWKAVHGAMQNHQPYTAEFRVLWADGTVRWVAANGKFYYSRHGAPERMLGMAVDITERKQAEELLQEREAELKEAQRLAQVGSWRWDPATDTVTWSEELYRIARRDPNLPAVSFREHPQLYTAESWERLRCAVEEALRTGTAYELELEMVRSDGIKRWISARGEAQRDTSGRIVLLRGTAQDITERKQAEEALSSLKRRAIEAEERERNRIAKDLHEDIGQRLALLAIEIEQLNTEAPNQSLETRSRMDAVWSQTLHILTDVKASAHELHSPRLEYLGIAEVMKCFCKEFGERKKVEIDFSSRGLPSLIQQDVSICLFRVLQEGLYNGVQHSGVQRFEVRVWGMADEIHLTVSDSGNGFDLEVARVSQGLGLVRIEERLKLVKGTFLIESQPKRGATIHAIVPNSSGRDVTRADTNTENAARLSGING
jgi:PAS domain S-box-containing protein